MNRNKALLACILLAGCSGSGSGTADHTSKSTATVQQHTGVLGQHCSACHAPPSPKLHSKSEWPSVVARMDMHRMDARMPALTDQERQDVLDYLESHAPE
jgi:mono/diheme cytochrome c family protein